MQNKSSKQDRSVTFSPDNSMQQQEAAHPNETKTLQGVNSFVSTNPNTPLSTAAGKKKKGSKVRNTPTDP